MIPAHSTSKTVGRLGFSLVEMLIVIAIIGVISAAAIPAVTGIIEAGRSTKNNANATHVVHMSAALASLGVAHVIPDSMGGVEATARLLREGVRVPGGPMKGEIFQLNGMSDDDITEVGKLLRVQYDMTTLRLVKDSDDSSFLFELPRDYDYCFLHPARIERISFDESAS